MKYAFTRSYFFAIVFFFCALNGFSQDNGPQTLVVKTSIQCDHCIQCGSCGPRIYESLKALRGIRKVKIDPEENTISVRFNSSKATAEQIKKAITEAGFAADDMKANEAAYARLDACCKAE